MSIYLIILGILKESVITLTVSSSHGDGPHRCTVSHVADFASLNDLHEIWWLHPSLLEQLG